MTCMRTETVEVSEEQLQELREFKACPYTGKSPKDFLEYAGELGEALGDAEVYDAAPEIARELSAIYNHEEESPFSEAWSERDNPVDTFAFVEDAESSKVIAKRDSGGLYI